MKDQEKATETIIRIQSDLDIGAKGMAKAMNITAATYRNKKNPKVSDHSFNQKNLEDLIKYLKNYVKIL